MKKRNISLKRFLAFSIALNVMVHIASFTVFAEEGDLITDIETTETETALRTTIVFDAEGNISYQDEPEYLDTYNAMEYDDLIITVNSTLDICCFAYV